MNSSVKLGQAGSPLPVSQLPFLILAGSVFADGVVSTVAMNISSGSILEAVEIGDVQPGNPSWQKMAFHWLDPPWLMDAA